MGRLETAIGSRMRGKEIAAKFARVSRKMQIREIPRILDADTYLDQSRVSTLRWLVNFAELSGNVVLFT